jgi:RNA polymerase sigma-70 factor (ECF subfamily)
LGLTDNYSNDTELADAIRAGSNDAFRRLVELYQDKVIRTCMGFVHSYADAEDIAQDVFVEVYQSIEKFRGEAGLSTWIYRIAVNKSLNFLRSAGRRKIFSFFDNTDGDNDSHVKNIASGREYCPDEELQKSEKSKAINQAMSKLPASQKTAFILSKYDEMSYQEIAEIMNISVSSVESLLFRARQNLRKSLHKFYKNNQE